jgi:hypothetical protein
MLKKLALMILVLVLISVFTIPPAEAGSKKLLKALAFGGLLAPLIPPPIFVSPAPARYYYPPQEYIPGHWEIIREWIPGTWERVWIPGHYDRWGRWVAGHYEDHQVPGHYVERKVWVEGYYRSY